MSSVVSPNMSTCASCGTKLKGNFCWKCGERKLNPDKDYSIHKFIEQTVDGFTHFDTKFVRSFKALLFKPGFLTSEFINGRRTRYMKPVQIFIIASVLFYFFYPNARMFFASVQDVWLAKEFSFNINKVVDQRAEADGTTAQLTIKNIELEAGYKSKAYLFFIIPFWGLGFFLLFWRSIPFIVPHIIFAAHCLSFLILLMMAYFPFARLLGSFEVSDLQLLPLGVMFFIYLFMATRKVYQRHIVWSLLKTIVALAIFVVLFVVYRQGVTFATIV